MPFKLGKLAPKHNLATPNLANFLSMKLLAKKLPPTPKAFGWEYKVPKAGWGMMGNDEAGNCVVAMAGHLILTWTSQKGKPMAPTTEQCLRVYKELTGWTPGDDASDTGLVLVDFLDYWRWTGLPCTDAKGNEVKHKILGHASVDIRNVAQLNAATYIFEGIGLGIQCPQSAVDDTSNWAVVPNSPIAGGHAIPRVGYGRKGNHIISWGLSIPVTSQFEIDNLDEAHAIVSEDALNLDGKSVSGFDKKGLLDALSSLN